MGWHAHLTFFFAQRLLCVGAFPTHHRQRTHVLFSASSLFIHDYVHDVQIEKNIARGLGGKFGGGLVGSSSFLPELVAAGIAIVAGAVVALFVRMVVVVYCRWPVLEDVGNKRSDRVHARSRSFTFACRPLDV